VAEWCHEERPRVLKGVGKKAHLPQLVKLVSGVYTVEHGSLGVISGLLFETDEVVPTSAWVSWVGPPHGKGGITGPIQVDDLEVLGTIYVECKD
jgi:hypothetical protein